MASLALIRYDDSVRGRVAWCAPLARASAGVFRKIGGSLRGVPRRSIPLRAVSALFLERQHLAAPRTAPLTAKRLVRFVEDVGGIQLDSINVLDRAHYVTVWSRFGPYDRARLDRLVHPRRLLFEYWGHAACLVPTSALPWWRRAMLDYRIRHTGWSDLLRRNPKMLRDVKASIAARGPLRQGDLERRRKSGGRGWWTWNPVQHALHYLWMTGALTIHSRRHFHKRFDLFERSIPAVLECKTVSREEFQRWHVERSLHAMGAATERDLTGYLTFPRSRLGARRKTLRTMIDAGEIAEMEVEGTNIRWFALTRDLRALDGARRSVASLGTTLLSPFDSLLWHRDRVKRLFGLDYRIEVYTPGHKRVHGYYTLPVLHQGHLIGRVDAKLYRPERRLEVRHAHFEPWFVRSSAPPGGRDPLDQAEAITGLAGALLSLGAFVGGDEISLRRVTPLRLRAPLARAIRTAAQLLTPI